MTLFQGLDPHLEAVDRRIAVEHLAGKDPVGIGSAGVKYTAGFVAPVMRDTYLANHEAPEDCEYYMCGPGMMSQTVNEVLDSLGVDPSSIHYDNFG